MGAQEQYFHAQVRHAIGIRNVSSYHANQMVSILNKANRELEEKLAGSLSQGMSMQTKRWQSLQQDIHQLRSQLWRSTGQMNKRDMIELAKSEQDFAEDLLKKYVPIEMDFATVSAKQLASLVTTQPFAGGANAARTLGQWWAGVARADQARIMESLQLGLLQGESVPSMVSRVRAGVAMSTQNATAVVRTAVNHSTNVARDAFFKENDDVIASLMWSAMLDGRTTAVCRGRDGHYAPVSGDSVAGLPEPRLDPPTARPPAHPQCRSQMISVLDPEGIAKQGGERPSVRDTRTRKVREKDFRAEARAAAGPKKWKKWTPKQRNAAIKRRRTAWAKEAVGPQPAGMSYDTWLRKQPAAFQDEVLGKTKGKLFRGGLKLDQFTDRKGAELTLKQLRDKHGLTTAKTTPAKAKPTPWTQQAQKDWTKTVRGDEMDAFQDWTGDDYTDIRAAQRTGDITSTAGEQAQHIENALNRAPPFVGTGNDLFRGMGLSVQEFEALTTSSTIRNQVLSSASQRSDIAMDFARLNSGPQADGVARRGVVLRVRDNKTGVDISDLSAMPEEMEVMLRARAEYRVVDTVYHASEMSHGMKMPEWWEVILDEI